MKKTFSSFSRTIALILALAAGWVSFAAGQTPKPLPARPADDEESGQSILEREQFFYTRRAGGPGKTIPDGAYERAVAEHQRLVKQRKESGVDGILPAWTSVNPNGLYYIVTSANHISGRTNSITWDPADPTTMYIGAAGGGVWKTTDDGASWVPLSDHLSSLASGAVAADPLDENILYLGTGELNYSGDSYYGDGLFKSTDAGASWFKLFDTFLGRYFSQIVVNPVNDSILYTASNQNVFKSTNMGAGWSNTGCGGYVNSLVIDPSNTNVLYAAIGATGVNSIRKTTNGGASWTTLTSGLPTTTMGRTTLALASSNSQVVYASISHTGTNVLAGVYRTTDGGASWTLQASGPNYLGGQGWYANSIAVDPLDQNTVAVGGLDVYVSIDGGVTFAQKSLWYTGNTLKFTHADIHFLGFNNGYLYCGSDGGVYRSPDNGDSWTDMNATLSTLQYQSADYDATDPLKMVGGTQDNNVENTTDGGANWSQYTTGDGGYTVIDPVTPLMVYSQYVQGSVERSENGGVGFTEISPNGASGGLFYNPYELAPGNHSAMVYGQANVWKTNSVQTASTLSGWTPILSSAGGNVSAIGISKTDDNKIYIGTDNGRILATTNNGAAWSTVSTGTPYVSDLAVDPVNDSVCYASFGGFGPSTHVYKTTNRGATWQNITSNLPNIPVNSIVLRSVLPRMIMLGTDLGVYISNNEGATWSPFNSGLPTLAVFDLKYKDGNKILLAATHGRGVFTYDLSGFSFGTAPTTLAFGGVLINTGKTDTVAVTNTGTASFSITSVASDNALFTVTPTSGTIAPSASMKFAVTYHPLVEGPVNATLTFTHTGITSPDIVSLSGTGSTPKFASSVPSMNFGVLLIGLSKNDSVTISNPGSVALNISGVHSTNTDFTVAPPSGSIPPLGSMKFYVTYGATATGTSSGAIIFDHNATSTPDSVALSGVGGVATAQFIKLEDADGDLATTGDRTSRKWSFSVYQNNITPGNLIGSGDSSRVTLFLPAGGTYILSEADSGLVWGRINSNKQRFDTLVFSPGSMAVDTFINRKYSTSILVADKWNMLSLPVIVADSSSATLFPDAITSAYKYIPPYTASTFLSKGIGYWVKFSGTRSYSYSGSPVDSLVVDTRVGWNLIGTLASPVPISNIVQNPPGIVYTPYFRYTTIYSVADTLFPGHAYWVKTLQAGELIMSSGQSNQPVVAAQAGDLKDRMSGLVIEDATGVKQTLFISARATQEGFSYEMPPRPPDGQPDVRFASGRIVEKYDAKSDNSYPLSLSSLAYPIVLSWDDLESFGMPVRISWSVKGRHFDRVLEDGGRVMISDTAATDIAAELRSRLPLPTAFALEQNYPNPFNPATVIRYSLPTRVGQSFSTVYPVSLRVYDMLGRLVATLVDEEQSAGYKSVTFDAGNFASGMYIYRLSAGSFSEARKMVIVK